MEDYHLRGWTECWNHYYSTLGQHDPVAKAKPSIKAVVDAYPHTSQDVLNHSSPSLMRNNDKLVCFNEQIDPSRYSTTSFIYTGSAGMGFSLADINFRAPHAMFEYIPKWFREAALKQDLAGWDMRKQQITADWRMFPRAMLAMIARLADDAFANLSYLFQAHPSGSSPLLHRVTRLATRMTQEASKWAWASFTSALVSAFGGIKSLLRQATGWVRGFFSSCVSSLRNLLTR